MDRLTLFTIGFTHKSAEYFFSALTTAGVARVLDVRLNNTSQLAGFAKKDDLAYFLRKIAGIEYVACPFLSPTQDMLDLYRKRKGGWDDYERTFRQVIAERKIEQQLSPDLADRGCLLCSEHEPAHCHRRIIAEYLAQEWGNLDVKHLM